MSSLTPLISARAALENLASGLRDAPAIGLDTEFLRERTYRAELCLLQLTTPHGPVCVDPLALTDLAPLATVLGNEPWTMRERADRFAEFVTLLDRLLTEVVVTSSGTYFSAEDAHRMGMVNAVVDHADLERVALEWAAKINGKSPTAQRMLKFAFNLIDDGLVGQQVFAGEATRLAYMTDEAAEGRDSFLEKRDPDWSPFPWHY